MLASGTLMTFGDQQTDFDVFVGGDLARITFEFLEDSGEVRSNYLTEPPQENSPYGWGPPTFRLQFFNLRYSGTFTDGPIRLGTVGGNSLWLVYEVTPAVLRRVGKRIAYTFWEGPAGDQSGSDMGSAHRG